MPSMNVIEMFLSETGDFDSDQIEIQGVREETITVWLNRPTGAVPGAGSEMVLQGKAEDLVLDFADVTIFNLAGMTGRSDHFIGQAMPIMRVIIRNKVGASPFSAWIIE